MDAEPGITHSLVSTAANVNDLTKAGEMLYGEEANAFGDGGYSVVARREEAWGPQLHIAMQPGKHQRLSDSPLGQMLEKIERITASMRSTVEHSFHLIKDLFRHRKTRYYVLAKNHAQLFGLFGLANLVIAKKRLFAIPGGGLSRMRRVAPEEVKISLHLSFSHSDAVMYLAVR